MGAPLAYRDNIDLWVSNGTKDHFCEIVIEAAKRGGRDISHILKDGLGVAGCYGVSGFGIEMEAFFPFFGGKEEFVCHLRDCIKNIDSLVSEPSIVSKTVQVLEWSVYVIEGGRIPKGIDVYTTSPKC